MQTAGAGALGVAAGCHAGVVAEHAQEVEARVAGAFGERVERGDVVTGFDEGGGITDHLLGDAGALAFRVAAAAGAKARLFGIVAAAEEADIAAERPGGRAAGPAIHAHGLHAVEEIAGGAVQHGAPHGVFPRGVFRGGGFGTVGVHHMPYLIGLG